MRIQGVDPAHAPAELKPVFDGQIRNYGQPFPSSMVMAHRPMILLGQQALSKSIEDSGLLEGALRSLINRRVASFNKCVF